MDIADPHRPDDPPWQRAFAAALAATLHQARSRRRITPDEIAARTGGVISTTALADYETGRRTPDVDVLWLLAGALGEPIRALVDEARGLGLRPTPDEPPP